MTEEIREYLGRESARERKMVADSESRERKQVLDGRRGRCKMCCEERERDDRAHVEWMGRNERGREWSGEKY
jgi:hypothetical protein